MYIYYQKKKWKKNLPCRGIEPRTFRLQGERSTTELARHLQIIIYFFI